MDLLTKPPSEIGAGTTVKWTSTFSDFPADGGWTSKFFMSGLSQFASGTGIAGVANGKSFDFTLTDANTALSPGTYQWQVRVYKSPDEYVAVKGVLIVQPNLEGAAANAGSFAEKMVAILQTAISGRLTADMQQYQIAGRAVVKIPIGELHDRLAYWQNEVWHERHPGERRSVRVRFSGVSSE